MLARFPQVRWIAFDAVGTLIRAVPSVAGLYAEAARRFGSQLSEAEIGRRLRIQFGRRTEAHQTNEAAELQFWRDVVTTVLDDVQNPEGCFQELFDLFAMPSVWQCFPDVAGTIEELTARGYEIAIASNFDGRLHHVADRLPPLASISTRVISSEVGWRKPSPQFYSALSDRCGCHPEELLLIGDDWEADFVGAQQAGLRAVFLDRKGEQARDSSNTVASLAELLEDTSSLTDT